MMGGQKNHAMQHKLSRIDCVGDAARTEKNKQIGKIGRSNELDNGHRNVKISGLPDFVDPTLYPEKGPKVGRVFKPSWFSNPLSMHHPRDAPKP